MGYPNFITSLRFQSLCSRLGTTLSEGAGAALALADMWMALSRCVRVEGGAGEDGRMEVERSGAGLSEIIEWATTPTVAAARARLAFLNIP